MTSSYSFTMSLSVTPSLALIDDRLVIKIKVAPPKQYITVCIHTKSDRGVKFASYGCFRTSDEGCVDISKDECLQGTYTGTLEVTFQRLHKNSYLRVLDQFEYIANFEMFFKCFGKSL